MRLPSHVKTFLWGSAIAIAGNIAVGCFNFFVRRTMALSLPQIEYGAFYGYYSLLSLLLAFTEFGLLNTCSLLTARVPQRAAGPFSAVFLAKTIIGILLFLLLASSSGIISTKYLEGVTTAAVLLMGLLVITQPVEAVFGAYYSGRKAYTTATFFNTAKAAMLFGLVFVLSKDWYFSGSAIAFVGVPLVFITIQLLYLAKHDGVHLHFRVSSRQWRSLTGVTGSLAFVTMAQNILFNMDSVMLTAIRGVEATALYNIALPITQLIFAMLVFANVFLPIAVDLVKTGSYPQLRRYCYVAVAVAVPAAVAAWIFMKFFGGWLIGFLFSNANQGAAIVLPSLCAGFIFYGLGSFLAQILTAMRNFRALVGISIFTVGCNVLLNFLLIKKYGLTGAAWATASSYCIFAILTVVLLLLTIRRKQSEDSQP